jgi:RNA polymerase sigma-70 factor (ECF subfamily)
VNRLGDASGSNETLTDEELVELILTGQEEVFACLYERYYSRAYRLAYGLTGRHEIAEDLTQEVFIRAYQKIDQFSGRARFSTWFYRLAVNTSLNYSQSQRRKDQKATDEIDNLDSLSAPAQIERDILQREVQAQIHRALFTLKPRYRLIVILRDIEGMSYEEIAAQVNCSTGTLAAQLKRARGQLARKLKHLKGTF